MLTDGRTDERTDRRTDEQTDGMGIALAFNQIGWLNMMKNLLSLILPLSRSGACFKQFPIALLISSSVQSLVSRAAPFKIKVYLDSNSGVKKIS